MAQIINMILDTVVTSLQKTMADDIEDLNTKATLVKKGLLQVNKIQNYIEIGVIGGNHEDPEYKDGIVTLARLPDMAMTIPAREIGGTQVWQRRFMAMLEIYYILQQHTETEAFRYAYEVLGRLMSNIETIDVAGQTDDFGETSISHPYVYEDTFFESGGPPQSYIFRGSIGFTVFTERP
jgi:hypothetical protein